MSSSSQFDFRKRYGVHSFVATEFPNDLIKEIINLNRECMNRLHYGPAGNSHRKGITFAIESPKCCPNYAVPNFSRDVPLRQYFGKKDIDQSGISSSCVRRWSYGVGSGSSTVGGDTKSTKTRPLTKVMANMCSKLNSYVPTVCNGKHCETSFDFNRVTILHYLFDSDKHTKVSLRKHTNLESSPSNVIKEGNSQKSGTPTVVIALQQPKEVRFYKRYSNGVAFDDSVLIGGFDMNHGDMFILHPADERVIKRTDKCLATKMSTNNDEEELKSSQFQHAVTCSTASSKTGKQHTSTTYRTHISVCFRQTTTSLIYGTSSDLMVDQYGNVAGNDKRTSQMVNRSNVIDQNHDIIKSEKYQLMTRALMIKHATDSSVLPKTKKNILKSKKKKQKTAYNH